MNADDRIALLEAKIDKLQSRQSELYSQLAQAQVDQWEGRVEDLEVQLHLGSMEANDRINALMDQLRTKWSEARRQLDDAGSTAVSVGGTLRTGLEAAVRDLRQALLESKSKVSS